MFEFVTPHRLFRTQIHALRTHLPGVLDGSVPGIHDARIATRRIREILPLLGDPKRRKHIQDLGDRFKRLGRSLGRVRDADVNVALLATLETRMPHVAPSLVVLRQQREQERLELLRKLVKKLERLEAVRLIEMLDEHHYTFPAPLAFRMRGAHWRNDLRYMLRERSRAARDAIDHATGVYFPDRAHAVRIALKKLRYAMEIAHETRFGDRSEAIRGLKKAQDLLGDLHDRQELIDNLISFNGDGADHAAQISLLRQVLDAEIHDLHGRYLARRPELLDICQRQAARSMQSPSRSLLAAAGAIAISSGLYSKYR